MGKDSSDIIRYLLFKNTPNIIPMLFPLCEVGFIYSGIVQMCTPCPVTLNRRAGTISTPLYTFSLIGIHIELAWHWTNNNRGEEG